MLYSVMDPKDPAIELDKKDILSKLEKFYNVKNIEELTLLVKADLRDKVKILDLSEHLNLDAEELFYYFIAIFPKIFNKNLIKNIKFQLNRDLDAEFKELEAKAKLENEKHNP